VCTFDSSGNPTSTDTSAARLQWSITGAQGEETTAVQFNPAPPPAETSGGSASAIAAIDAVREGDNFINVFLLDANGAVLDSFSLEKQVHRSGDRSAVTSLTARASRRFVRGKAKTTIAACKPDRKVTLFRRRRGIDDVVGTDQTNRFGRWAIKTGNRPGTYYARIAATSTFDADDFFVGCLSDQSRNVRRR
jgi:hypothetical protein